MTAFLTYLLFEQTQPAGKIPFLPDDRNNCSAAFLYALTFLVFEKMLSTLLGQRVRDLMNISNMMPLPTRLVDGDMPLLKIISGIFNIIFCYKLIKKFHKYRYMICYTRV